MFRLLFVSLPFLKRYRPTICINKRKQNDNNKNNFTCKQTNSKICWNAPKR